MICTLFISREGEDLTTYDEVLNKEKIQDWKKEGIDAENFFTLAFNSVNGFMPVYNGISQNISQHLEKVQEEIGPKVHGKKK